MLSKQELDAALAAERAMYRALSEVQDITRELLDAVDRQDQVSVRLFLSMRQEQINQLRDQKELLKKHLHGLDFPLSLTGAANRTVHLLSG